MKRIVTASFCLPIVISAIASPKTQSLSALKNLIKNQQQQLAQQSKQIQQLSIRLTQLEKNPKTGAQTTTTPPKLTHSEHKKTNKVNPNPKATDITASRMVIGTKKSNLTMSGQISAISFYANDGKAGHVFYGTDAISNSRINVDSKLQPSKNLTIGSRTQLGFDVNPSNTVSQTTPSPAASIDVRRAEAYLKSKYIGELSIGKGETASDNTAYTDFSGTKLVARASEQDIGGGLFFRNRTTGALSSTTVNSVINGLDGFARKNRIRYDSPTINGFNVEASAIEGGRQDVALKFGHKINNSKLAAQIAFTSPQTFNAGTSNSAKGNELNASASVLFPIGISLTGASGEVIAKEVNRKKPYYYYSKVGYQRKFINAGLTALSIDGGRYFHFAQNGDRATGYGAQALQNINAWDLAAYLGYRHFKLHRPGTTFDGINLAIAGVMYYF